MTQANVLGWLYLLCLVTTRDTVPHLYTRPLEGLEETQDQGNKYWGLWGQAGGEVEEQERAGIGSSKCNYFQ